MEPFVPRLERGDVMLACLGVGLVVRVGVKFRVGVGVGDIAWLVAWLSVSVKCSMK